MEGHTHNPILPFHFFSSAYGIKLEHTPLWDTVKGPPSDLKRETPFLITVI